MTYWLLSNFSIEDWKAVKAVCFFCFFLVLMDYDPYFSSSLMLLMQFCNSLRMSYCFFLHFFSEIQCIICL